MLGGRMLCRGDLDCIAPNHRVPCSFLLSGQAAGCMQRQTSGGHDLKAGAEPYSVPGIEIQPATLGVYIMQVRQPCGEDDGMMG